MSKRSRFVAFLVFAIASLGGIVLGTVHGGASSTRATALTCVDVGPTYVADYEVLDQVEVCVPGG